VYGFLLTERELKFNEKIARKKNKIKRKEERKWRKL